MTTWGLLAEVNVLDLYIQTALVFHLDCCSLSGVVTVVIAAASFWLTL